MLVAVEVTGEEEDLVVLGLALEKGTDLLPAGGIGMDQAVIEDDRIGVVLERPGKEGEKEPSSPEKSRPRGDGVLRLQRPVDLSRW